MKTKSLLVCTIAVALGLSACGRTQGLTSTSAPAIEAIQNIFGGSSRSTKSEFQKGIPNPVLYQASQDVLGFLPLISANPQSGVLQYGYGVPPRSNRAYKATVHISNARLDARSLQLSLESRSGPVSAVTRLQVEEAIFTRARQLRIASNLAR